MPLLRPSDNPIDYKTLSHPTAKQLLNEDFFWCLGDELGPVGTDSGADALANFWEWRKSHQNEAVLEFIHSLLLEWGYDEKRVSLALNDWNEGECSTFSNSLDDIVIAIGFGQFFFEGVIDASVKEFVLRCIKRQQSSNVVKYRTAHDIERLSKLQKMQRAVQRIDVL